MRLLFILYANRKEKIKKKNSRPSDVYKRCARDICVFVQLANYIYNYILQIKLYFRCAAAEMRALAFFSLKCAVNRAHIVDDCLNTKCARLLSVYT